MRKFRLLSAPLNHLYVNHQCFLKVVVTTSKTSAFHPRLSMPTPQRAEPTCRNPAHPAHRLPPVPVNTPAVSPSPALSKHRIPRTRRAQIPQRVLPFSPLPARPSPDHPPHPRPPPHRPLPHRRLRKAEIYLVWVWIRARMR